MTTFLRWRRYVFTDRTPSDVATTFSGPCPLIWGGAVPRLRVASSMEHFWLHPRTGRRSRVDSRENPSQDGPFFGPS